MNEPRLTVVGMVTTVPVLNHTKKAGLPVANFRITSTARSFNRERGRWVDGATLHLKVVCWRRLAENVAASVQRGDPVLVSGTLSARSYQATDGARRWSYEVNATSVGPDLSSGTATFARNRHRERPALDPEPATAAGDVESDPPSASDEAVTTSPPVAA